MSELRNKCQNCPTNARTAQQMPELLNKCYREKNINMRKYDILLWCVKLSYVVVRKYLKCLKIGEMGMLNSDVRADNESTEYN